MMELSLANNLKTTTWSKRRRDAAWGYFFISPWLIGFLIFTFFPIIASLGFSMYDFVLSAPEDAKFIGFDNWERMLGFHWEETPVADNPDATDRQLQPNDKEVWKSLAVTFKFAFINLPIGMISAFLLAVLLNSQHLMGKYLFRTLFYAPTMVPAIAGILIWSQVLDTNTGWMNRGIEWVTGFDATSQQGLRWKDDPNLIYITYTLVGIWGIGNAILINLSALQGVPTELYDAARVDGAGWLKRLYKITLPMVSPVIFYNLILGVIGLLQFFIVPYVINGGNGYPEETTKFFMIYFFKQSFTFANMGYGATLAWLMFIIALAITLGLFGTARYWVYYSGGDDKS